MDKNAYLKELSRHLSHKMPEREREDTLRWYEEYFQEAGPEREAEGIEELGPPGTVARRVAEEGGWTQEKKVQPGDGRWDCRSRSAVDCRAVCRHLGCFAAYHPC